MPASAKPKALLISPEAPYPCTGGGALRTASLLHYLDERYELDLIVFELPGQNAVAQLPASLHCRARAITLTPHRREQTARIARNLERLIRHRPPLVDRYSGYDTQLEALIAGQQYEVAVLEHFWAASYIPIVQRVSRRTVLDLHNVESAWHEACARVVPWPQSFAYHRFARAAVAMEHKWFPQCSLILAASAEDAARVKRLGSRCTVYPNAVPAHPLPNAFEDLSIGFSGNLEYEPNRVAVRFFLEAVWPLLTAEWPDLRFRIIGKNRHAIQGLIKGAEGVECSGPVDDPVEELARVKVVVAPLLSGSGTRLKIIEAWAAGRAVVSTHIGAEGLGAEHGQQLLLADDPVAFAGAVSVLLQDSQLRSSIAARGRSQYEKYFTWQAAWRTLDGVF